MQHDARIVHRFIRVLAKALEHPKRARAFAVDVRPSCENNGASCLEKLMSARLFWSLLCGLSLNAMAQPNIFKGADVQRGEQLMSEAKCEACHIRRVGGDGSAMYKPMERLKNAGSLRGMVDYCSTQLNLGFFPEDSTDVAAALNRKHYHFKE
jgi:hypothetical protein